MFVPGKPFQPSLMIAAPALLVIVRLGWNVLSGSNTLAYYEHLKIMGVKIIITSGPGDGNREV